MAMCVANECRSEDGVTYRRIEVNGITLRHVPLCSEHYNEINEAKARASWGANY